jgi:hypothetical protein
MHAATIDDDAQRKRSCREDLVYLGFAKEP